MANVPVMPRGGGIVSFAQECWSELQKVTWPDRDTIVRLTVIVIAISVLIAVYIFLFDNLFTYTVTNTIVGAPTASPAPSP